jgi:hypothetical protein
MTRGGRRARIIARSALVALVVAWLFSETVRSQVPTIFPLLALLAIELEVAIGAFHDRGTAPMRRELPGEEDADLGFGELVEDEYGVRLVPPAPRPERRLRDRWPLALGVVGCVAVIAVSIVDDRSTTWDALSETTREATRQHLQAEASRIAAHPVRLECSDESGFVGVRSDALGVAYPSRGITYLRTSVCRDLYDVIRESSAHGDRRAESILVLAHEAVHLGGEPRENVTECLALQAGVGLGRRLGLADGAAARVMRGRYLTDLADRSLIRLEYRLPKSCHDGGELDQDPGSSRFP